MPTPPTTRTGRQVRERILLYGDSDSGKTYNFLKVAEWHQRRGSDAVFWGLCSPGNEWDRLLMPGAEFEHLENVRPFDVEDMQDYFDVYDGEIRPHAKPEDWLAIDVIDAAWQAAQDEYAKREWKGRDLGSKWAAEGGQYPITGWEWGSINARYRAFIQNRVLRFPGHVMALAWEKELQDAAKSSGKGGEDQDVLDVFGLVGRKPAGQKDDYKRFSTLLHLAKSADGKHVVRTARDRQRPKLGRIVERGKAVSHYPVEVGDFFMTYLVKVAKWRP